MDEMHETDVIAAMSRGKLGGLMAKPVHRVIDPKWRCPRAQGLDMRPEHAVRGLLDGKQRCRARTAAGRHPQFLI